MRMKPLIVILLWIFTLCSFSSNEAADYKRVVSSDSVIEYNQAFLSPNGEYLALIKWLREKAALYRQEMCFLNFPTIQLCPQQIRNLLNNSEIGYVEKEGISWDLSGNFYFLLSRISGTSALYKYNMQKSELKEMQLKPELLLANPIAISPEGNQIAFRGQERSPEGHLYDHLFIYHFANNSVINVNKGGGFSAARVVLVWLDNRRLIYSKNANIYINDLLGNEPMQLTNFTEGLITLIQPQYKGNKIFFIRQEPPVETLIEEKMEWLRSKARDQAKEPMFTKEFWEVDLNTRTSKMIASFKTMKNGTFRDDSSIIIPLPREQDYCHLYLFETGGNLKQLTFANAVDDSPVAIFKNKILFRRDYKNIMMLDMSESANNR